jgi:hypothetical protein
VWVGFADMPDFRLHIPGLRRREELLVAVTSQSSDYLSSMGNLAYLGFWSFTTTVVMIDVPLGLAVWHVARKSDQANPAGSRLDITCQIDDE